MIGLRQPGPLKTALYVLALILLASGAAQSAEVVHFASLVPPAKQNQDQGTPLWGHLSRPEGSGPFPALVLMHGCSGISQSHVRWAKLLNGAGYLTLILDSFGPRSVFEVCQGNEGRATTARRALDAHGALAYLRQRADVDPERIGVIGWSHGAISALGAVATSGVAAHLPVNFTAAIAFYPFCLADRSYALPVLVLIGEKDEWTPAASCRALEGRVASSAQPVEFVFYPGAHHGFDNSDIGKGFAYPGPYGSKLWLEYDKEAHEDSIARLMSFLTAHLNRNPP